MFDDFNTVSSKVEVSYNSNNDIFIFRVTIPDLKIYSKRIDGIEKYHEFLKDLVKQKVSMMAIVAPTNVTKFNIEKFQGLQDELNKNSIYS